MTKNTTRMSDGQDKKEGGSAWELSEAIKLMGEAQASGDREQIGTAMRRHSEALTNATNEIMIPTLKNVLETVLKSEIGTLTKRIESSDRARLLRNNQFQEELNNRLDGHAHILDEDIKRLAASVEGAAQLAGKAYRLAEEAQAGVGILKGRVESLETHGAPADAVDLLSQLDRRVRRVEQRQIFGFIAIACVVLAALILLGGA